MPYNKKKTKSGKAYKGIWKKKNGPKAGARANNISKNREGRMAAAGGTPETRARLAKQMMMGNKLTPQKKKVRRYV